MGYADLSCYGARDIRTPRIDSLARGGVRMTQAYANGPVCTPTRCGLLTGRYQQRTGLEWALIPADRGKGLNAQRDRIIARDLREAGYRTGLFGKWHLGSAPDQLPNAHGFERVFGLLGGNVDMYSHEYRDGSPDLWDDGKPVRRDGYLTESIADEATAWMKKVAGEPFFCYVPFNAVHWPFQRPNRPDQRRTLQTWFDGDRQDYKFMLESMDAAVGKILDTVRALDKTRDTLVIFTNDNGGERLSDNRPFFHHKQTLFEGGIRVPTILRWPGQLPAGRVSDQVAASMDLGATILAATGVKPARALDGIDLTPILSGRAPVTDRTLFWRIQRPGRQQRAVRRGRWKYMLDAQVDLLFDVVADPGERTDLYYGNIERALGMRKAISEWEAEMAREQPPYQVL
jgi:arylsulfatase A